jgi:hypothetical protein
LRGEIGRGPPKMVVRLCHELALVFANHYTFVLYPRMGNNARKNEKNWVCFMLSHTYRQLYLQELTGHMVR